MTKTGEPTVPYEEAVRRLRARMVPGEKYNASALGGIVWPNNRMRAQGLAFAMGRLLRRMQEEGVLVWRWDTDRDVDGYEIL